MPQMAPLSWLSLLMMFTLIIIIISVINYSISWYSPYNKLFNKSTFFKSWKW